MLQFIRQFDNGFRLLLEQKPFIRQRDGTFSPDEQRCTQFILQLHQLAAESRLGNMKDICGSRNISLIRHCQKVFQYTQFHLIPSC